METSIANQIEKEIANLQAKYNDLQKQEWTKENFAELSKQEDLLSEAMSAIYRIKQSIEDTCDFDAELIVRSHY